ncbi:hypothetical protein AALA54_15930 [Oscillospiraceae bacterium 44-34]
MNSKKFSEAMGELDSKYVDEAISYRKKAKKSRWVKWGTIAACFCLVVVGITISQIPNIFHDRGAGVDPGGTHPNRVDPIIASLAQYPATESIEDVADATSKNISEADAYGFDTLGEYLPTSLPEGYHFGKANLYETTMKNGTKYYMLRVTYTAGEGAAQENINEAEEVAVDPNTLGESFVVFVMNYKPSTKKQIYEPTDITESKLEQIGNGTFHISYGDIYVGISPNTATPNDIFMAVTAIK